MTRTRNVALALATIVVIVAAVAVLIIKTGSDDASSGGVASDKTLAIKASDGVTLSAEVVTPSDTVHTILRW